MRRFFVLVWCVSGLILGGTPAFAQYTSQSRSSAVKTGETSSAVVSSNSSARYTRSAPQPQQNTAASGRFTTNQNRASSTGTSAVRPAARNTSSTGTAGAVRAKTGNAGAASAVGAGEDDLDVPDFNIVVPKEVQGMSQAQKVILLEEFARKKQAEKDARIQAEADRKAAIAKKIAEETPKPGMVFDENGVERPIPKGEIWTYVSEFSQGETRGRINCSWKMVLQNRTNAKLEKLKLKFTWPSYTVDMSFQDVAPNATKTEDMFMYSPTCPSLRTKPRVEPKNCILGPMKDADCNQFVVLK